MAAASKAWIWDRLLAGIAGSNPAGSMISVCCDCCVLSGRGLCVGRPTDCSVSNWTWSWNLDNEEDLAHWGLLLRGEGESELCIFLDDGENSRPIRFHVDIKSSLSILNFISVNIPERKAKCWTIQLNRITAYALSCGLTYLTKFILWRELWFSTWCEVDGYRLVTQLVHKIFSPSVAKRPRNWCGWSLDFEIVL
jgi:hypothetical protein